MESLTKEQIAELDMTRLHAISEALNTPMTVPMTVAEGQHVDHPICGATCTDKYKHSIVTEWKSIDSEAALQAANGRILLPDSGYRDNGNMETEQ